MALIDYQTLVDKLARDDADKLDADDRDTAIAMAVQRYSKDRPQVLVEDVTAIGGYYLNLPLQWDFESSVINDIEYPIGEVPPIYVVGGWIYKTPSSTQIAMPKTLAAGEQVRLTFTAPHILDVSKDTLPVKDREAVVSYAAAVLCDQLATLYSGDSDSTIQADTVDHSRKSGEFSARASKLRKRYFDELGIDPKRHVAAGVVIDLDLANSRGHDRLTHPAAYR